MYSPFSGPAKKDESSKRDSSDSSSSLHEQLRRSGSLDEQLKLVTPPSSPELEEKKPRNRSDSSSSTDSEDSSSVDEDLIATPTDLGPFLTGFAGNGGEGFLSFLTQRLEEYLSEGPAARDEVIGVCMKALTQWEQVKSATKEKLSDPGIHRLKDGGTSATLTEKGESFASTWKEKNALKPSKEELDPKAADTYLDILAKDNAKTPNDAISSQWGSGSNPVTSNCSLVALGRVLGCKSGEIPQWMGQTSKSQSETTLQPTFETGLKGGHTSQMDGLRAFAEKVISPEIKVDDPLQGKKGEERKQLPATEGVEAMRQYPPGTQFVVFLDSPGAHFVYAECRGGDVVFEDWQPVIDMKVQAPRFAKGQKGTEFVQESPTVSKGEPTPTPFEKDPKKFKWMEFIAFVPSPALIDKVGKDGHGGSHDAIRGSKKH